MHLGAAHKSDDRASFSASPWVWVAIVTLLGFALRLLGAGTIPVMGDELSSLGEAQDLLRNPHGIAYFALLRPWMLLSGAPWHLRLLSVVLSTAAIPAMYGWLRSWRSHRVAFMAAALMAVSPLAIEYAREIRYYALFLTAAILSFWAYAVWRRAPSVIRLAGWLASCILLAASHLMAVLCIGLELLDALLWSQGRHRRWRVVLVLSLLVLGIGIVAWPPARLLAWSVVGRLTRLSEGGSGTYPVPRGLSWQQPAKAALALYQAFAGNFLYPLNLVIVIPVAASSALAILLGLLGLGKAPHNALRRSLVFVLLSFIILFLILDALLHVNVADSATFKFVIFVLPILLWWMAEGCAALLAQSGWRGIVGIILAASVFAAQLLATAHLHLGNWSRTAYKTRAFAQGWQEALDWARSSEMIVAEGHAMGPAQYYLTEPALSNLAGEWGLSERISAQPGVSPLRADSITVLSTVGRPYNRCHEQPLMEALARDYTLTQGLVRWPLFAYQYEHVETPSSQDVLEVPLPRAIYGIELQDLLLPVAATWQGYEFTLAGAWALPDCEGRRSLSVDLPSPSRYSTIVLASNVLPGNDSEPSPLVADLSLLTDAGEISWPVRLGQETGMWDDSPADCECESLVKWHKRVALVGESYYPGAYRDFQARIWVHAFSLPQPHSIQSVQLTARQPGQTWYVWGVWLLP